MPGWRWRRRSTGSTATTPPSKLPYERTLAARIYEPTFRAAVGEAIVAKARIVKDLGNAAAHEPRAVPFAKAATALRELFHIAYWLTRTYGKGAKPAPSLAFSQDALPRTATIPAATLTELQAAAQRFVDAVQAREQAEAQRQASEAGRTVLEAELGRAARRGRRRQGRQRPGARHPRLRRGRHPRLLHRPPAGRGRLDLRQARPRHRVPRHRHAQQDRHRLRRLRAVGRRRQAPGAGGGQAHHAAMPARASSRPSSTPTAWRSRRASARSSSIPTATSTTSGTTCATRRARSRASSPRTSWSSPSAAAPSCAPSPAPTSTPPSSSATTRRAPSAASPRRSRRTTCARRCW